MDIVLRIVTITFLMVIALGVIARPQHWRWTLCCVAVALGVSAFVLGNATTDAFVPKFLSWPWIIVIFMSKTIVLYVWLFVQCSFDDEFRFDRFRLGVSLVWLAIVLTDMWRFRAGLASLFGYTTIIMALTMMGHLIWTLLRGREDDLRLRRRTARIWISAIMVSLLLMDLMIDVTMGFSWRPAGFIYLQNGFILLTAIVFAAAIFKIDISAFALTPSKDIPNHQVSGNAATLNQIMSAEQLYLRPDLRLSDVVARLPISEAATRSLIHDEFGYGHFRSFLNQYRVKHAQDLLRSPDHQSSKLIAIAFDSGFASLASFQRAFKKETGLTASEWRMHKA